MQNFDSAFKKVCELVDDFKKNEQLYLSPSYQEADVRRDYIDKFFEALGWDVYHNLQKDPSKQEVKVERPVNVGRAQKRADYAFSTAPKFREPKFFVEAKKPSRNLRNPDDYFQTIRYGWNANTPVAVLTDFEEFHILDCRFKPDIDYVLQNQNHKVYKYTDYKDEEKFGEIYFLFSRDSVAEDSLQKYSDELPKPKGKATQWGLFRGVIKPIDEAFLDYINNVRTKLAKAFKKNDHTLDSEQLTEVTQKTVDRLVFIRFLEDKLIEPEYYISELGKKNNPWREFINLCKKLDAKYNGIVFKTTKIDEQKFSGPEEEEFLRICEEISHLNSPYDFHYIPIHILGSIYEQFLGKIVKLKGRGVTIEEKPEVRKAGGVYYTPKYIVDYIVQNTIGKLIENKTPEEISEMHFADIACGSGSFLIGVYELLLEYHKNYYQNNPKKAEKDGCVITDGLVSLSLNQKQDILLNNIYGVDIDSQAVEVTQLSLALKMLEDESTFTTRQMEMEFRKKIIPERLSKNIVCGNSLIGTDILAGNLFGEDSGGITMEEERKLKPMDFETVFPHIFKPTSTIPNTSVIPAKAGIQSEHGFDAIVGNPPYVKEYTDRSIFEYVKKSELKKYYQGKMDLWYFFVCYGLDLLKKNGLLGYIAPNNWVTNAGASMLRTKIITDSCIINLIDFGDYMIFENASIQTMILIIKNDNDVDNYNFDFRKIKQNKPKKNDVENIIAKKENSDIIFLSPKINKVSYINKFLTFEKENIEKLLNKILNTSNFKLSEKEATNGIHPHHPYVSKSMLDILGKEFKVGDGIFCLNNDELIKLSLDEDEKKLIKPYYSVSELMNRYYINTNNNEWVIYTTSNFKDKKAILPYPNIKSHLDKYEKVITSDNKPYGLHRSREEKFFIGEKIISLRKCLRPFFVYSEINNYFSAAFYIIKTDRISLKYLTAILNSKLIEFWLKNRGKMQGVVYQIDKEPLLNIPIVKTDLEKENQIVSLVDRMLNAKKQLHESKTDNDKNYYQRRCEDLDRQIDAEVYKLYGLTEEEIIIVEGNE